MCTFKVLNKKVYISRTGQIYLEVSQSDNVFHLSTHKKQSAIDKGDKK